MRSWDEELGEVTIKGMNAGHFKHGVLDFDEMNIHCQCVKCNKWNSGELDIYAEHLIRDYGLDKFNDLCSRAKMAIGEPRKEQEWYLEKIQYYQKKILML